MRSPLVINVHADAERRAEVIQLAINHGYFAEQIDFDDRGRVRRAWDSQGKRLTEAQVARRCRARLWRAATELPGGVASRIVREHEARRRQLQPKSPPTAARRAIQRPRSARRAVRPLGARARAPDPEPEPAPETRRVAPTSGVPS